MNILRGGCCRSPEKTGEIMRTVNSSAVLVWTIHNLKCKQLLLLQGRKVSWTWETFIFPPFPGCLWSLFLYFILPYPSKVHWSLTLFLSMSLYSGQNYPYRGWESFGFLLSPVQSLRVPTPAIAFPTSLHSIHPRALKAYVTRCSKSSTTIYRAPWRQISEDSQTL